jgi:dolichol-phosphate mannosyltransferase
LLEKGVKGFPSTLVLLAALNEEEGIGPTIAELNQHLEKPRIFIVDGKSHDRTVEIAKNLGAEILRQNGKGKGNAIAEAIQSVNMDVGYVVFIDADYTYPAEYIPEMIRMLEENPRVGMICGNRFNEHLDTKALHGAFRFGNRLLAFAHNILNGIQLRDPLTGLRVARWSLLKGWKPKSKGFDIEVELNHYIENKGFDIVEIPIRYRSRLGEKKLKLRHGATILKRILSESM